ncbi:DUF4376 domain-containing protein [Ochrobactrum sp. XJ1]|nr:DUF4376 domain-containing protein [Ochrobactrum sp. XJ1]
MIKNAKYTEHGSIVAVIDGVEMTVPDDMVNRHRVMLAEWEADGNTILPYSPPPPTSADVDRERDRRIDGGFSFGGVVYQTRSEDRENIAGAATASLAAIMNGVQAGDMRWHGGDTDFVWIAADNSTHPMDAPTMFAFGQAAMAHKQAHIFAARTLKDAAEIPADYTDDLYWPPVASTS